MIVSVIFVINNEEAFLDFRCVWDMEVGKKVKEVFPAHCGDVVSISLSPDNSYFVTGSVDRTCKLWDFKEMECKQTFFGHEADVNSVCVREYYP